jgi:predicted Fe-Mo cluster-binding NifX family protein
VKIRRAGPFIFSEVGIEIEKSLDVNRGHEISHRVVREVRSQLPQVESLTVHIEPFIPSERKVMIPLESNEKLLSKVSSHFGRANFFAFVELSEYAPKAYHVRENSFKGKKVRAGLAVVNRFIQEEEVDTVIVREIGEIGFHTLRDHYIEIYRTEEGNVEESLAKLLSGSLTRLEGPTHGSEEGISAEQDESAG